MLDARSLGLYCTVYMPPTKKAPESRPQTREARSHGKASRDQKGRDGIMDEMELVEKRERSPQSTSPHLIGMLMNEASRIIEPPHQTGPESLVFESRAQHSGAGD